MNRRLFVIYFSTSRALEISKLLELQTAAVDVKASTIGFDLIRYELIILQQKVRCLEYCVKLHMFCMMAKAQTYGFRVINETVRMVVAPAAIHI